MCIIQANVKQHLEPDDWRDRWCDGQRLVAVVFSDVRLRIIIIIKKNYLYLPIISGVLLILFLSRLSVFILYTFLFVRYMRLLIIFCPQVFLSECLSASARPHDCIIRVPQINFFTELYGVLIRVKNIGQLRYLHITYGNIASIIRC